MMQTIVVVLACIAGIGCGRRVQTSSETLQHSQSRNVMDMESDSAKSIGSANAPQTFAQLLLASIPFRLSTTSTQTETRIPKQSGRHWTKKAPHYSRSRPVTMMASPVTSLAIFGIANAIGFFISAVTGWHYHLDLIGTGVFGVSAFALRGTTRAQTCSAGAIGLWATKLASFLFYRVLKTKKDARLSTTLSTISGQFGFWFISFLWGWFVSLPHTLAADVTVSERPGFGAIHIFGLSMFAVGFVLETAADYQKWMFKADPANAGRFCDIGVWRLCQHPNWLGNMLLWSGIFVLNAPTLLASGSPMVLGSFALPLWVGALTRFVTAAISPLFLFWLFSGQANGVPPLQQGYELMKKRFGSDADFLAYEAVTPPLVPSLTSIKSFLSGK